MRKIYIVLAVMLYSAVSFGQMTFPFSDDFETYIVGEKFVNQVSTTITDWTTWSNAPGGDEDPMVSDAFASSGTKSIKVVDGNDMVLKTGDLTESTYSVSFKMYIPTGSIGYYNMLQEFSGGSSKFAYEIKYIDGTATVNGPGDNDGTFLYDFDKWFEMKIIIDLDIDWCEIFMDNNLVFEFKWSAGTSNTNLKQFAAIDFYGFNNNVAGTGQYYFDDISIKTVESAAPPTNVTATVENENDVVLTWAAPTDATPDAYVIFRDTVLLAIAQSDKFTYTDTNLVDGDYYYFVRSYYFGSGGYSKPDTINVTITTSINYSEANSITLYPNPVKDILYINGVMAADKIEVRSITGKLIYSGTEVSVFKNGFNTGNLIPGVYTVIVYDKNNAKVLRFVK